jgi:hypothetical protein
MNSEFSNLNETMSAEALLDRMLAGQKLECGIHTFSKQGEKRSIL